MPWSYGTFSSAIFCPSIQQCNVFAPGLRPSIRYGFAPACQSKDYFCQRPITFRPAQPGFPLFPVRSAPPARAAESPCPAPADRPRPPAASTGRKGSRPPCSIGPREALSAFARTGREWRSPSSVHWPRLCAKGVRLPSSTRLCAKSSRYSGRTLSRGSHPQRTCPRSREASPVFTESENTRRPASSMIPPSTSGMRKADFLPAAVFKPEVFSLIISDGQRRCAHRAAGAAAPCRPIFPS